MPNNENRFSWRARAKSFRYAWDGIRSLLRTEHNSWIHLALTLAAVVLGILLHILQSEWIALIIVMALVWMTELLNTCIEKIMDFIHPEYHPKVKVIKDMAAAAVLIMAITAVLVGGFIFIPKLF